MIETVGTEKKKIGRVSNFCSVDDFKIQIIEYDFISAPTFLDCQFQSSATALGDKIERCKSFFLGMKK